MKKLVLCALTLVALSTHAKAPVGPPKVDPFCREGTELVSAKNPHGLTPEDQAAIKKVADKFLHLEVNVGRSSPNARRRYEGVSVEAYSYDGKPGTYPLDSVTVLDWRFGHLCIAAEGGIEGINVMYLVDVASVSMVKRLAIKSRQEYNSYQSFFDPWEDIYVSLNEKSTVIQDTQGFEIRKPLQPIVWMSIGVIKWGDLWQVERTDGLRQFRSLSHSIQRTERKKRALHQNPACRKREEKAECWTDDMERVLNLERSLMRKPWSVVPVK